MSRITHLVPSDLVVSNTNTRANIINRLTQFEQNGKVLFIFYDLKSNTLPDRIISSTFSNPSYIIYGSSINLNTLQKPLSNFPTLYNSGFIYETKRNYGPTGNAYKTVDRSTTSASITECNNTPTCTGFYESGGMSTRYSFYNFSLDNQVDVSGPDLGTTHIKRINNLGTYAVKIFAYITIPVSREYTFSVSNSDKIKLFLNSFLILNTAETNELTNTVFLSSGTYLLYIEKIALSNDNNLNISVRFTNNGINSTVPLDTFNQLNYTPISNAINSRDNSILKFCDPNTNLFVSNNVCSTSLQNNNLLNSSVNNFCFNPTLNVDSSTKKMNNNCRNTLTNNDNKINNSLKTVLTNSYHQWANKVVSDNKINDNYDPLLEYIQLMNPSQTDFSFNTNISNTCENNLKNVAYDVTTQNNNELCKRIYTRNYTGTQKTNVDNSIQQIKNNFCDPNQTTANLNDSRCTTEYTTKNNLSNALSTYCFPNNVVRKVNNTYDPNCKRIHNLNNLNTDIRNNLNNRYNTWARNTINNSSTNFSTEELALNEFVKDRNPDRQTLFGLNINASNQITNYCETQIGDKFQADPNQNNLCNSLYSSPTFSTDPNIKLSIDKIKTQYCTKDIDGVPRYENDQQCIPEYTNLLKNTIENRCIQNGSFNYSDKWCTNLSNTNINNKSAPYSTMTQARTNDLKKDINSILVQKYENNKVINENNYNYAINQYATIPNTDKKLSDELLNNKLFDYCENIEPNFPLDPESQCKGIYDTYKEEVNVINSRNKIRDNLCQQDEHILTELPNDLTNNTFNCKSTVFNLDNEKFAPVVNSHCSKNSNITSTECQNYYNDIENKILDSLNLKVNTTSAFSNNDTDDYDNRIELSSFQNCNYNDETDEYDFLYLILLFLLFILIVCFVSSCLKCKKNKKEKFDDDD